MVNTVSTPRTSPDSAPSGSVSLTSRDVTSETSAVQPRPPRSTPRPGQMPELDQSLIARLPVGVSFSDPATPPAGPPASAVVRSPAAAAVSPAAAVPPQHSLSAAISVLTGPAAGKRYPLEQKSVTIGKEGKQVIECQRIGTSQWQVRQREGVIPAFVNGDALNAPRDLVAGDVIEMTGVRLRFEVVLHSR